MPSLKINTSVNGEAGISLEGDWLTGSFDRMTAELPKLTTKALNTAGYILKEAVRNEFVSRMPAAGRPFKTPATSKGGYKITRNDILADAVRQSSADEAHVTVFMGGRDPGSPLFISRMYNKDSKERFQKTYRGTKLKKGKRLGNLTGVHYWDPGISRGYNEAMGALNRILSSHIKNTFEN